MSINNKEDKAYKNPTTFPPKIQNKQPGIEAQMEPAPIFDNPNYKGSGKLKDKVIIITGGDSGIGRAVAVAFAKEGANIVVTYLNEHEDAEVTKKSIEKYGGKCLSISGDISKEIFCKDLVENTIDTFGKLDIIVNNAAIQYPQTCIEDITEKQLEDTFKVNIFSMFYLTKATMPHLKKGSAIINTASVTAYEGNKDLIDYSATKGAIVTFTRSLALSLADKGIRVNAVAPGPIWTPLIVASFDEQKVKKFGETTPMKAPGEPYELAPAYVYLASEDSSYVSGQVIHVNGGIMVSS